MGETSALACLIGAVILLITRIGSWRIMAGVVIGTVVMVLGLNAIGSDTNPSLRHSRSGGTSSWEAGPSARSSWPPIRSRRPRPTRGRWIYGILIGVLAVLVRVVNPAYPEGMMLAILLMNVMAPLIDHFVVAGNVKRRMRRYAT